MNHVIPMEDHQFQLLSLEMQNQYVDFTHKYPLGSEVYVFDDAGRISGPFFILSTPELYAGEGCEEFEDLIWIVRVGLNFEEKPQYYFITSVFVWDEEEDSEPISTVEVHPNQVQERR
ncbi:MAG: hypothetical protein WCI36_00850 [bacterium]